MQNFEETILNNWANRFQCSVDTLKQRGTTLLPDEKYADRHMITLWRISEHTFARFDPAYTQLLKDIIAQLPVNTSLSGAAIQRVLGDNAIESHDVDLIHYLPPAALPDLTAPPPFSVRALTLADQAPLATLHNNCTPEEVDNGYVEIDHEIIFGCFHGNELVSAASGYRMAGFMDIGVLTHSKFRKLGLGNLVVAALSAWAIEHNVIAQYRCNIDNLGSMGIAKSLKFRHYFGSENIVLIHQTHQG